MSIIRVFARFQKFIDISYDVNFAIRRDLSDDLSDHTVTTV